MWVRLTELRPNALELIFMSFMGYLCLFAILQGFKLLVVALDLIVYLYVPSFLPFVEYLITLPLESRL